MNRALRAATMGVLLLSPVALSACSAGQVTQTATQDRDKTGGQAKVGGITLRAVELEYPRGGTYSAGDDAGLRMAIVNTGSKSDTLTGVSFTLAAPFVISIPLELNASLSGVATTGGLTSMVSPPAPGRSLSVSVMPSVLNTFICGIAGVAGASPTPQKQPLQMG